MDIDNALKRKEDEKVRDIIGTGSDMVGDATGVATGMALGFLIGGPGGAVAGAAAGPPVASALRGLAVEFRERVLGHREELRAGATITLASAKIKAKLENGDQLRQDDFFTDTDDNRATAKEVFEGVILAAQREPEEKKVRLYANLLANLAFVPDVDRSQANFLLKLGEDVSYRQLCLLSLFAQNTLILDGDNRLNLRASSYRSDDRPALNMALVMLLQETYDLYQRGIVNCGKEAMIAVGDVTPSQMSPQGVAVQLYNLMELGTISPNDLHALIRLLR